MSNTIVLAGILAFIVAGFFAIRIFNRNKVVVNDHHSHENEDGECCGRHSNCSKGHDTGNLYFEDEELDRFKGTKQEDYTEADIEEFRHVLYTMKTDEVDTWAHCLQTRGIEIPQEIKDEILLMLQ
ncbi:MAG: phospholipase [Bacteroidaceae bacterium]|nr:phospholipase [Bacteroidaceae bacterium]